MSVSRKSEWERRAYAQRMLEILRGEHEQKKKSKPADMAVSEANASTESERKLRGSGEAEDVLATQARVKTDGGSRGQRAGVEVVEGVRAEAVGVAVLPGVVCYRALPYKRVWLALRLKWVGKTPSSTDQSKWQKLLVGTAEKVRETLQIWGNVPSGAGAFGIVNVEQKEMCCGEVSFGGFSGYHWLLLCVDLDGEEAWQLSRVEVLGSRWQVVPRDGLTWSVAREVWFAIDFGTSNTTVMFRWRDATGQFTTPQPLSFSGIPLWTFLRRDGSSDGQGGSFEVEEKPLLYLWGFPEQRSGLFRFPQPTGLWIYNYSYAIADNQAYEPFVMGGMYTIFPVPMNYPLLNQLGNIGWKPGSFQSPADNVSIKWMPDRDDGKLHPFVSLYVNSIAYLICFKLLEFRWNDGKVNVQIRWLYPVSMKDDHIQRLTQTLRDSIQTVADKLGLSQLNLRILQDAESAVPVLYHINIGAAMPVGETLLSIDAGGGSVDLFLFELADDGKGGKTVVPVGCESVLLGGKRTIDGFYEKYITETQLSNVLNQLEEELKKNDTQKRIAKFSVAEQSFLRARRINGKTRIDFVDLLRDRAREHPISVYFSLNRYFEEFDPQNQSGTLLDKVTYPLLTWLYLVFWYSIAWAKLICAKQGKAFPVSIYLSGNAFRYIPRDFRKAVVETVFQLVKEKVFQCLDGSSGGSGDGGNGGQGSQKDKEHFVNIPSREGDWKMSAAQGVISQSVGDRALAVVALPGSLSWQVPKEFEDEEFVRKIAKEMWQYLLEFLDKDAGKEKKVKVLEEKGVSVDERTRMPEVVKSSIEEEIDRLGREGARVDMGGDDGLLATAQQCLYARYIIRFCRANVFIDAWKVSDGQGSSEKKQNPKIK